MLATLIVCQLVFDVAAVLLLVALVRRARPAPAPEVAPEPPAWYREFLALAQDLLVVTEPVLDALDRPGRAPAPAAPAAARPEPASAGGDDRFRQAFALMRGGAAAEEVVRRSRLLPGEARLIKNLVAAEAALDGRHGG
jgi:hypothetical protein